MKNRKKKDNLIASEALYAFLGWLSTRKERVTLSGSTSVSKALELLLLFLEAYDLREVREGWENKIINMPEKEKIHRKIEKIKGILE